MTVSFREAVEADIPHFVDLLKDDEIGAARETSDLSVYLDVFRRVDADPFAALIIGESDGRVVACYQLNAIEGLSHNGLRLGQLEDVRVARDLRGQGIGKALIADAFDRARAMGCKVMQLVAHKDRAATERFYRGVGFTVNHNGFKAVLE